MPKIEVWECDHDGTLHKTKAEYVEHLKTLAKARLSRRQLETSRIHRAGIFQEMRKTCRTSTQILSFIRSHWDAFTLNGGHRPCPLESIEFSVFGHSGHIINTTTCPFDGVTNWERDPGKPLHYIGWTGKMKYRINSARFSMDDSTRYGVEIWNKTGINIGDGSYYGYHVFDIHLFELDWPAMRETYAAAETYKELKSLDMDIATIVGMFDSDDKIRGFRTQYPGMLEHYLQAKTWKALKSDPRPLSAIIEDFNE